MSLESDFRDLAVDFCRSFEVRDPLVPIATPVDSVVSLLADECRKARRGFAATALDVAGATANIAIHHQPIGLSRSRDITLDTLRANAMFAYTLILVLCDLDPDRIPPDVRDAVVRMLAVKDFNSCGIVARMLHGLYGGPAPAQWLRSLAAMIAPPPPP